MASASGAVPSCKKLLRSVAYGAAVAGVAGVVVVVPPVLYAGLSVLRLKEKLSVRGVISYLRRAAKAGKVSIP